MVRSDLALAVVTVAESRESVAIAASNSMVNAARYFVIFTRK